MNTLGVQKVDEKGNVVEDPTSVKLMTIGGTVKFQETVQNNFKDITGEEVTLEINPKELPIGLVGKSLELAQKAIVIYNKALKENKISNEDMEFLIKYLPVKVVFSNGTHTFLYSMNWNMDSEITDVKEKDLDYKDQQHQGEVLLRSSIIRSKLNGGKEKITVKVKGQLPGKLNYGEEEKTLSEMNGFMENPMSVDMYVTISGNLTPVNKNVKKNPYAATKMTYMTADGNRESWDGVFAITIKGLNGLNIPLKVNTRNHDRESAGIIFDLYSDIIAPAKNKDSNVLNVSVKDHNPGLFERIKSLIPSTVDIYGEDFTYKKILNDFVFEGMKTKGRTTALYFENGVLHFGNSKVNATAIKNNKNVKDNFIKFIETFKAFNVNAALLSDPNYRRHVFTNYLSTNANIDDMITADGTPNPTGNSVQRMQSGAIYLDTKSIKTEIKEKPAKGRNDTESESKGKMEQRKEDINKAKKKAEEENTCKGKGKGTKKPINRNALKNNKPSANDF